MTKGEISKEYIILFSVITQEISPEFNCKARSTASEYM